MKLHWIRFEFLILQESSATCRQGLEYNPSNNVICICPHCKIALLYTLMNVAETDVIWHLRLFRKCTIWWLHDKELDVSPNWKGTMFIFKLTDEKKKGLNTAHTKDVQTLFLFFCTTQGFLNATVNMQQSHSSSTVNPPKQHCVLTAKQERGSNEHSSALSVNADV